MQILSDIDGLRAWRAARREAGRSLALVPTMGNLHAGHLSLVARAVEEADEAIASIFVNPLQFGPDEDYASYPRTLEADVEALRDAGCTAVFTPERSAIYPGPEAEVCRVEVPGISEILCGAHRPGHFSGVATVVAKLFNLVDPEVALFGLKDYQQLTVIRRMAQGLGFGLRIVGVTTVRAEDGLALSSRNSYLDEDERRRAPVLYQTLRWIAERITDAEHDFTHLQGAGIARLQDAGFRPEYLEVREADSLVPAGRESRHLVLLAAAQLGRARLIDNLLIER